MPVSVEQVEDGFRLLITEARDWFRRQTEDERDEELFLWPWVERVPPRMGAFSGITEEEFQRTLAEWLAKFKAATAVYLKAKARIEKGDCGSFDVGYGLTVEIESNARRFAPAFLADRQAAGYSYAAEYFEMVVEKLETWTASSAGYGGAFPFSGFWAWFETTPVHGKFAKLEAEIEELITAGSDDRKRIEDLARKWDESLRWAIREFAAVGAQTHEQASQAT
jgi:hypothetical protein